MTGTMTTIATLCRLDEIASPGSKGFSLGSGADAREIFVVRNERGVFAYENVCPHTWGPLDWVPDQFLSHDKARILCATHGAVFRIEDGHCLYGPCMGKSLATVAIEVVDGSVVLAEATKA
jgi:nitrite reductase/ring-hydroxylating ferredoxin subunit